MDERRITLQQPAPAPFHLCARGCSEPLQQDVYKRQVEHPVAGTYQMAGSPLKFSSLTEAHYEPAPTLGQHTREILSERLNMTDTEIEALLKEQESMP